MFESWSPTRRSGVTQPMLAFAIHVGVLALAVGGTREVARPRLSPDHHEIVIYNPDPVSADGQVVVGGGRVVAPGPVPPPVSSDPGLLPLPLEILVGQGLPGARDLLGRPDNQLGLSNTEVSAQGIYQETELSDPPVLLEFTRPVYPARLREAGVEGLVTVTYVIERGGRVEPESVVIVSSDRPEMAESVRVALATAMFRPGRFHGQPVRVQVRQTVRFAISSDN